MGYDHRIGFEFLKPGPGWGGSCFPKDTQALLRIAEENDFDFALLRGAVENNRAQFDSVAARVISMVGGAGTPRDTPTPDPLAGVTVAAWGLAFKAGTNDIRDSPALEVIKRLVASGARVQAYDPAVDVAPGPIDVVFDPYDAVRGADVLVVLTEWPEFATADLQKVRELMATPCIVDTRNVLPPMVARTLGFRYDGFGSHQIELADARETADLWADGGLARLQRTG